MALGCQRSQWCGLPGRSQPHHPPHSIRGCLPHPLTNQGQTWGHLLLMTLWDEGTEKEPRLNLPTVAGSQAPPWAGSCQISGQTRSVPSFGCSSSAQRLWRSPLYSALCFKWPTMKNAHSAKLLCGRERRRRERRQEKRPEPPAPALRADPH